MLSALTDEDRADLQHAATLVQAVANRHPLELTGPIVTLVQATVHDIHVLTHYLEEVAE